MANKKVVPKPSPAATDALLKDVDSINRIDNYMPGGINTAATLHTAMRPGQTLIEFGNNLVDIQTGVRSLVRLCYGLSRNAGWHQSIDASSPEGFAIKVSLIHSEVSEALEAARKPGTMDSHLPHRAGIEVELADAVIRIFDLAGANRLNLADAILEKLAYNQRRLDHGAEARSHFDGKKI